MSLFFYLINIAANVVNRYYRYCQWCRYYRWKQVPALRFISTFSAKFRMIIRIPKKYADNSENRLYRYLRPGFSPKNLFNFYKKSNKIPQQNPSFVPPPSLPALPLLFSSSVALNVAPKRCRLWFVVRCKCLIGSSLDVLPAVPTRQAKYIIC